MVCTVGKSGKAAPELKARPVYTAGKCCFKFLYKYLWGYQKPQHYRLKRARSLSRAFPPTAHVRHLFLTTDTKLRYFAAFQLLLFLGCNRAIWVLSSCIMCLWLLPIHAMKDLLRLAAPNKMNASFLTYIIII